MKRFETLTVIEIACGQSKVRDDKIKPMRYISNNNNLCLVIPYRK